jgi:hypothetical protein
LVQGTQHRVWPNNQLHGHTRYQQHGGPVSFTGVFDLQTDVVDVDLHALVQWLLSRRNTKVWSSDTSGAKA